MTSVQKKREGTTFSCVLSSDKYRSQLPNVFAQQTFNWQSFDDLALLSVSQKHVRLRTKSGKLIEFQLVLPKIDVDHEWFASERSSRESFSDKLNLNAVLMAKLSCQTGRISIKDFVESESKQKCLFYPRKTSIRQDVVRIIWENTGERSITTFFKPFLFDLFAYGQGCFELGKKCVSERPPRVYGKYSKSNWKSWWRGRLKADDAIRHETYWKIFKRNQSWNRLKALNTLHARVIATDF